MDRARLTLDNPVFAGRLRQQSRSLTYARRPVPEPSRVIQDIVLKPRVTRGLSSSTAVSASTVRPGIDRQVAQVKNYEPVSVPQVKPQRNPIEAPRHPQRSNVLKRNAVRSPRQKKLRKSWNKQTAVLYAMAAVLFIVGVTVSLNGLLSNRQVAAQVQQLQKTTAATTPTTTGGQSSAVPSTKPVSTYSLASYTVAPDLARYLKIPKLGVNARVLQVGVTKDGSLATPNNVFDTAWYNKSSKPGLPGATLIDGHVSSWTTNGVFYGLKSLVPNDKIIIQRGDGTMLTYKVVSSKMYPADKVDMQAAMTPIVAGHSGLNLITCAGSVKPGTSEFNERIIVFATLEN